MRDLFVKFSLALFSSALGADSTPYAPEPAEPLYRIVLWRNGNPASAVTVAGKPERLDGAGWDRFPECNVRVIRSVRKDGAHWEIVVAPKGNYGVAEVQYPVLRFLKLPEDYLLTGKRCGQRLPMDYVERHGLHAPPWAPRPEFAKVPDQHNKSCLFYARSPSSDLTLQMVAYENRHQGIMLWTQDTEFWIKDFLVSYANGEDSADGYEAAVVHFPQETGQPGTGFSSRYPVVTTSYEGGWYGAARIYRKWAARQWWCSPGRIYDRAEVPPWFKEVHAWYGVAGRPDWVQGWLNKTAGLLRGRSFGAQWMNWSQSFQAGVTSAPQFLPPYEPEAFRELLSRKTRGTYLAPYFIFSIASPLHQPSFTRIKSAAIKNYDHSSVRTWTPVEFEKLLATRAPQELPKRFAGIAKAVMKFRGDLRKAWGGPIDRALIARLNQFPMPPEVRKNQARRLAEYWGGGPDAIEQLRFYTDLFRMDLAHDGYMLFCMNQVRQLMDEYQPPMVYLDTFPHTPIPCYDRSHQHPLGYGPYMAQGHRAFCSQIFSQYPYLVIACESGSAEYLLDLVHVTYHKGIVPQYAVPLFAAVYQGYLEYTNWWMFPPYGRAVDFTSSLAFSTHLGYMPGGAVGGGPIAQFLRQLKVRPDDPKAVFFRKTIDIRGKFRDFLAAGTRLNDVEVSDCEPVTVQWANKGGTYLTPLKMRPVQASLWLKNHHPDQGLILLSNFSGEKQRVTVLGRGVELLPFSWKGLAAPGKELRKVVSFQSVLPRAARRRTGVRRGQ